MIKKTFVETSIKAYEQFFEEMQRELAYEPGATIYPVKVIRI